MSTKEEFISNATDVNTYSGRSKSWNVVERIMNTASFCSSCHPVRRTDMGDYPIVCSQDVELSDRTSDKQDAAWFLQSGPKTYCI